VGDNVIAVARLIRAAGCVASSVAFLLDKHFQTINHDLVLFLLIP
jgi:hypothetical protein